jgi:hypothetical protein
MHRPENKIEKEVKTETDPVSETSYSLFLEYRKMDTA